MQQNAWLLLSKTKRDYFGNQGYGDIFGQSYPYDSKVQNYKRVQVGDIGLITDGERLLGIGRIREIQSSSGFKTHSRCPVCGASTLWQRTDMVPRYRCRNKHEFDEPRVVETPCLKFTALFDVPFLEPNDIFPVAALRKACPQYNQQLSMQLIDLDRVSADLAHLTIDVGLLQWNHGPDTRLPPDAAEDDVRDTDGYEVRTDDTRSAVNRTILARRGQGKFRQALRARYGDTCPISGCTVGDLLEAAHIQPYRGEQYNHVENGVLLRSDLHTLFDLGLLGIDPDSLTVHVAERARKDGYELFHGKVLCCASAALPGKSALQWHWAEFQRLANARSV